MYVFIKNRNCAQKCMEKVQKAFSFVVAAKDKHDSGEWKVDDESVFFWRGGLNHSDVDVHVALIPIHSLHSLSIHLVLHHKNFYF